MVDKILGRVNGLVNPADGEECRQVGGVAAHHEEDEHPPGDEQHSGGDRTREIMVTSVRYLDSNIPRDSVHVPPKHGGCAKPEAKQGMTIRAFQPQHENQTQRN